VNPFLPGKTRPLVVGHRGVPLAHQENTLAGFRKAVELGVPAVELDVRLTADGVPVLFHDDLVDRLTGAGGAVADLTWDKLSRLKIRRELHMGFGNDGTPVVVKYPREEPIARLDEVLSELRGKVAINVELKTPMPRWWSVEVGVRTAEALKRAGMEGDVILTSFDPRRLQVARKTCAELLVGFCYDDTMLDFACPLLDRLPPVASKLDGNAGVGPTRNARLMLNRLLDSHVLGRLLGMRVVGADHTLIGPDTVTSLHRRGVAVGTHTLFPIGSTTGKLLAPSAGTREEVARLVELGVDWIESDDPEKLMGVVHGN
jgi:glycerophosphoryl diester phosphodiesterase